jgi:ribosomal protein S6
MRKYEIMFVVRPDIPEEEVAKLITQMEGVATGSGGTVEKVEKMGRRRLAYRVARQREGFYVLFVIDGSGDMVKEFERRLKVADPVIKFMTVRVDEECPPTTPQACGFFGRGPGGIRRTIKGVKSRWLNRDQVLPPRIGLRARTAAAAGGNSIFVGAKSASFAPRRSILWITKMSG